MSRKKIYTEEEFKNRMKENAKRYYQKNKERLKEYGREYGRFHRKTPIGRANYLLNRYNQRDIKCNRGIGDLTPEWIVDNILTKPCNHCGKMGWDVIGCNRLDNSKPHTMDNVEPCCEECNCKIWNVGRTKKVDQIDNLTGEVIKTWNSALQVEKELGYDASNIRGCCTKRQHTCKGYIWKYIN